MAMLAILPFFAFLILYSSFLTRESCWRRSFLSAAIVWGVLLVALTELLSSFFLITMPGILGAWIVVSLFASILLFYLYYQHYQVLTSERKLFGRLAKAVTKKSFLSISLFCLGFLLILTLLVALQAPPNNYDSMTYHMSRVMHWMQNQSVAHYPANNWRQVDSPPWSSFAIMQFQVLSGGDRLANLVQWFSMAGVLIGVSLIAKELHASLVGQLLACIVCATIPMGLLQSVTTQNDYVVSFWLVCLAYNALLVLRRHVCLRVCLEFGGSLGLALLTKGTAYIYAFPFVMILAVCLIKYFGLRFWKPGIALLLPTVALNYNHWWRNFQAFGDPLGVTGDVTKNRLFTLEAVISNLVRNIALNIPVAYQPINDFFEAGIIAFHDHILRLDVNDPRTTFSGTSFSLPVTGKGNPIYLNEDTSGNPLTLGLFSLAVVGYIVTPRLRNSKRDIYLFSLAVIILLLNALLAWQPWGTRLQLPFFVLASPFIGSILGEISFFYRWRHFLLLILTLAALPYILFSAFRPILSSNHFVTAPPIFEQSRLNAYLNLRSDLRDQYFQSAEVTLLAGCYDIGLSYLNGNTLEYPFWPISDSFSGDTLVAIRSVTLNRLESESTFFTEQNVSPCAIFVIEVDTLDTEIRLIDWQGKTLDIYSKVLMNDSDQVQVYFRKGLVN